MQTDHPWLLSRRPYHNVILADIVLETGAGRLTRRKLGRGLRPHFAARAFPLHLEVV